jgi:hypothetical protein
MFASKQAEQWREIISYMDALVSRPQSSDESGIYIPSSERPAYFEWVIWRAFLAIDHLTNKPYESRRFKIDQSFLPISPSPGNGPDLICEFKEYILVIEVTLTENSRQEAAEGETVRRHIADIAAQSNKPVYGLFIAKKIDTNTAETFRVGVWFAKNDEQMQLSIVPITLNQFKDIFRTLFETNRREPLLIKEILDYCLLSKLTLTAPLWKTHIEVAVASSLQPVTG